MTIKNLYEFGENGLIEASRILLKYNEIKDKLDLDGDITLGMDDISKQVYLIDTCGHIVMINEDKEGEPLEEYHVCPLCGVEGFPDSHNFMGSLCHKCFRLENENVLECDETTDIIEIESLIDVCDKGWECIKVNKETKEISIVSKFEQAGKNEMLFPPLEKYAIDIEKLLKGIPLS